MAPNYNLSFVFEGEDEVPLIKIVTGTLYDREVEDLHIHVTFNEDLPFNKNLWSVYPSYPKDEDVRNLGKPFAHSESAAGAVAVMSRIARQSGANLKKDDMQELGQWAVWADGGRAKDRHSRGW